MRALLGLKLFGTARHSHVMSDVFDEGLALFARLNACPKRAFLTEYSCRIDPRSHPPFMQGWFDTVGKLGLAQGHTFDLDLHTIPYHGDDALMEKRYVSKRGLRQKGVLALLAQDAGQCVFCYAHGEVRKADQADEILRFIDFWRERTGRLPGELAFISLTELNRFAETARSRRRIENSQHWVLDVQFSEEANRSCTNRSAENLALIRRAAMNLLRQRKLRAAFSDTYREHVLFGGGVA